MGGGLYSVLSPQIAARILVAAADYVARPDTRCRSSGMPGRLLRFQNSIASASVTRCHAGGLTSTWQLPHLIDRDRVSSISLLAQNGHGSGW
jgi:hypothetical protein